MSPLCFRDHIHHQTKLLVQPLGRRHRSLDRQAANILPPFLQQADQVVDSQHDVRDQFILRHTHIANRHTQTQHLLQLELDCRFDFCYFGVEVFGVRDGRRELASFRETGTEETGDLLDEGIGGDEGVVLAGEFLDELFVFVKLLEIV
jgi:hypothetical protein